MTGPPVPADAALLVRTAVPNGFFDEIAASLETETAEDIADAVIEACTRRGILHPELEDDPEDELRAEEVREVFALLASVTDAVADGTIIPSRIRAEDEVDFDMAQAWESYVDSAADPEAAAASAAMLSDGKPIKSIK